MSTKADALLQRAARGERVKAIRDALEMTQPQFADALTRAAKSFGLHDVYDKAKISRLETGGREVTVEEAGVLVTMDPERRGWDWLVFGDVAKKAGRERFKKLG